MKWFDANGTDIDAHTNEAFRGGVYDRQPSRLYKKLSIECGVLNKHKECKGCECLCHKEKK